MSNAAIMSKHNITASAMRDIMRVQRQIVPMLLVAGMGAELVVHKQHQPDEAWTGPAPLPLPLLVPLPVPSMPRPIDEIKAVRSNHRGLSPYEIFTVANDDDPIRSSKFDPRAMPKEVNTQSENADSRMNQFTHYVICPNNECGRIYTMADAIKFGQCVQFRAIHLEQPTAKIAQEQKKMTDEHRAHVNNEAEHIFVRDADAIKRNLPGIFECCNRYTRCGAALMEASPNTTTFNPVLLYPYRGIELPLRELLQRRGFEKKCEIWRDRYDPITNRRLQQHTMADIWDGQLWEEYQFVHEDTKQPWTQKDRIAHETGNDERRQDHERQQEARMMREADEDDGVDPLPFVPTPPPTVRLLASSGTLVFALNLDWYEPFTGTNYSMGAIYLTVLNLPREERYLTENMILVGLLPGPKQTSREQLQGALGPLMVELNNMFGHDHTNGMSFTTADRPHGVDIKAFLMCVISDSPAARKIGGTMTHSSNVGCPYCMAGGTGGTGGTFTCLAGDHKGEKQKGTHWSPAHIGHRREWDSPQYRRTNESIRRWAHRWSTVSIDEHKRMVSDDVPDHLRPIADDVIEAELNEADGEIVNDESEADDDDSMAARGQRRERSSRMRRRAERQRAAVAEAKAEADQAKADAAEAKIKHGHRKAKVYNLKSFDRAIAVRNNHASMHGSRYCALMDLPYFEMRRGIPLDVMHNIYLGLCKEMMVLLSKKTARNPRPILNDDHLDLLQRFMEYAICPSDIGSIPGKIGAQVSKFKSAEWMNWQAIFCVPAMRYLWMSPKKRPPRMTEKHMELLSIMQRVAVFMQGNVITVEEVHVVEKLLENVIDMVEELWPGTDRKDEKARKKKEEAEKKEEEREKAIQEGREAEEEKAIGNKKRRALEDEVDDHAAAASSSSASAPVRPVRPVAPARTVVIATMRDMCDNVKPNLHYSQHLYEMLLDYGPPVNWWCNSYERFNGLLAGFPNTPTHIEICTMRRHLLMVDMTHTMAEMAFATSGVNARPFTPSSAHYWELVAMMSGFSLEAMSRAGGNGQWLSVHTTANRKSRIQYSFGIGKEWVKNYTQFEQQRRYVLQGDGTKYERHLMPPAGEIITHSFENVTGCEIYPGLMLGKGVEHKLNAHFDTMTGKGKPYGPRNSNHIIDILRMHYAKQYWRQIIDGGVKVGNDKLFGGVRYNVTNVVTKDHCTGPMLEKDFIMLDDAKALVHLSIVYDFVIDTTIVVHETMEIAGEKYGSLASIRSSRNSFVAVNYREWTKVGKYEDRKEKPHSIHTRAMGRAHGAVVSTAYARIQYMMQHTYQGELYSFALLRYHNPIEWDQTIDRPQSDANQADEKRFPLVSTVADVNEHRDELMPVQRILHRWVPALIPVSTTRAKNDIAKRIGDKEIIPCVEYVWQVCPIHPKVHGG